MFRFKKKKKKNLVPKFRSSWQWCYCVTAKQGSCSGGLFPHLSQHFKKAMAILPSRFIQNLSVELSALLMVTLKKNTKDKSEKSEWKPAWLVRTLYISSYLRLYLNLHQFFSVAPRSLLKHLEIWDIAFDVLDCAGTWAACRNVMSCSKEFSRSS